MQALRTRIRLTVIALVNLTVLMLISSSALAQSAADNIRPVGQVCLANQACVGTTAGQSSSPVAAVPAAEPAPAAAPAPEPVVAEVAAFDAAATFQMSCFACHGTGAAGAPMLGDAEVWDERTSKGMEALMANVLNGINAMPARGLCMTCSDDNLQELVDYMISQ